MDGIKTWHIVAIVIALALATVCCCAALAGLVVLTPGDEGGRGGTDWPQPACTPPACRVGEVYYCPGACPGGCGTICATPTPGN